MSEPVPEPAQTYLQLRSRILSLNPSDLGLSPTSEVPHVWGVIMETGYEVGSATLVSLADGTTSLYISTGGGMLGSADYEPVAVASRAMVAQAEQIKQAFSSSSDFPLPRVGQVRFTLLTYEGTISAEAPENELIQGTHPLASLYTTAQQALTQLRLSAEKKRK